MPHPEFWVIHENDGNGKLSNTSLQMISKTIVKLLIPECFSVSIMEVLLLAGFN